MKYSNNNLFLKKNKLQIAFRPNKVVRKTGNSSLWEAKGAALVQTEDYKAGVCADVSKTKNHKLQQKKLQLEMRGKRSFTVTMIKYWNRLPRVCTSLSLQEFKAWLYKALLCLTQFLS